MESNSSGFEGRRSRWGGSPPPRAIPCSDCRPSTVRVGPDRSLALAAPSRRVGEWAGWSAPPRNVREP
eukprot:2822175-Pyramimonas_sp.AAC.1